MLRQISALFQLLESPYPHTFPISDRGCLHQQFSFQLSKIDDPTFTVSLAKIGFEGERGTGCCASHFSGSAFSLLTVATTHGPFHIWNPVHHNDCFSGEIVCLMSDVNHLLPCIILLSPYVSQFGCLKLLGLTVWSSSEKPWPSSYAKN